MTIKFPYPIADWREINQYPLPTAFDVDPFNPAGDADPSWAGKRWAWEFLRRNPEYQQLVALHPQKVSQSRKLHRRGQSLEVIESPGGEPLPLEMELYQRFGLPILIDPMRDDVNPFELAYFNQRPWAAAALPNFLEHLEQLKQFSGPEKLLIEYDLTRPLAPQLKQTEAIFNVLFQALSSIGIVEARHRRKRFDRYTRYLRILDARSEKVSNAEIAASLYSSRLGEQKSDKYYAGESQFDKDLQVALRLVKDGYREIPVL